MEKLPNLDVHAGFFVDLSFYSSQKALAILDLASDKLEQVMKALALCSPPD